MTCHIVTPINVVALRLKFQKNVLMSAPGHTGVEGWSPKLPPSPYHGYLCPFQVKKHTQGATGSENSCFATIDSSEFK